jgi:hypothetical protein
MAVIGAQRGETQDAFMTAGERTRKKTSRTALRQ